MEQQQQSAQLSWYYRNKDKVLTQQREYYRKNKKAINAKKPYKGTEEEKAKMREYYYKHKDKRLEYSKKYQKKMISLAKLYLIEHPEIAENKNKLAFPQERG